MRFGSLFSGIEAASVAWLPLGWTCAWVAEIDPFACAVLRHHYPDVRNLGDITEIAWDATEPVDLVVGGPPCQDFSVAGNRAGIDGEHGNLSLAYVRALDAIDPAWSLTENVPGWLSMGDNAFGHFLGRLVGHDAPLVPGRGQRWTDAGMVAGPKRTAAWRILDAQYFGVPQRRRRVFVVAVRGAGNWACAEALFPQQQSVPRHPPPRREAGEDAAGGAGDGSVSCRPNMHDAAWRGDGADNLYAPDIAYALSAGAQDRGGAQRYDYETETLIAFSAKDHGADAGDTAPTLRAGAHYKSHANAGVMPAIAYDILGVPATNGGKETHIHTALRSRAPGASEASTTTVVAFAQNQQSELREMPYAGAVKAEHGTNETTYLRAGMSVRRLTPVECERLQGFPDDFTLVPYRGKPAADGPRYRAIGNSMAVPVVRWIGHRIQLFEEMTQSFAEDCAA